MTQIVPCDHPSSRVTTTKTFGTSSRAEVFARREASASFAFICANKTVAALCGDLRFLGP
jgi:hypothetical protein